MDDLTELCDFGRDLDREISGPSPELRHRVLGAGGRIVFPKGSTQFREQARRLKSDGVPVKDGRVPRALLMSVNRFD